MTDRAYWAFTSSSLSQQASEFPVYGFIRDQLIFQPMMYQVHSPLQPQIILKYVLVNYSKEDSACTTWNSLINFLLSFLFDLMKNLNTLSLGCGDHGFHRKSTLVRLTKCQCRMCILLHTTIALELNTPDFFNSDLSLILLCETYIAKSGFLFMVWSQILLFPVLLLCL